MEKTIVKTFESPEFSKIRVIMLEGQPWFAGKDVTDGLGYVKSWNAMEQFVDSEDKKILTHEEIQNLQITGFQSPRGLTIINESGLYSLILSSKLENAKKFKRWVTSEVLPSIRKTGSYGNAAPAPAPAPYVLIPKFFRGKQVITVKDAAVILNTTTAFIDEIINKPSANIHEGKDYYRLKGDKRAEFKNENLCPYRFKRHFFR